MRGTIVAGFVAAVLLSGCTMRLSDFSVVSIRNSNVPAKSIGKRVTGESCVFSWFGVNWFGNEPNLRDAFDKAMENAGSDYDALVDAVVYRRNEFLKNCYQVKGVAINTKTAKGEEKK